MTKEDLKDDILTAMTTEYYGSNLCQMIDNPEWIEGFNRGTIEEAVFEWLDDLSNSVVETMEENGVLKVKKKIPA